MAEYKTFITTNIDYNARMTVDDTVAVTMHGSVTSANPGNYNLSKTVANESVYEANKAKVDEQCSAFEEKVKASADVENNNSTENIINDESEATTKILSETPEPGPDDEAN